MEKRRILLVDDEQFLTEILSFQFTRLGATVVVADDGAEGLELARSETPHLIVTDYQMPKMDGLQLGLALATASETSRIPVIMLTGRGHLVDPGTLAQTNIKALIAKPFSAGELIARVESLLGPFQAVEHKAAEHKAA